MHVKTNTTGYADALICEAEGLESLRDGLQLLSRSTARVRRLRTGPLQIHKLRPNSMIFSKYR